MTRYFIIAILVIVAIYDILAALFGGIKATLSWQIWTWSTNFPIIPLAVGVVIGHLFWRLC